MWQMNQQRKSLIPKTLTYALTSIAFTIPAAWLAVYGACIIWDGARLCAWPGLYPLAAALATMAVVAPIGLVYRERARRRAARGMWQKVGAGGGGPGAGWLDTFERTVAVMWGSEAELPGLITGEMRYQRRGWWLNVQNGQRIFVDRWEFWQWLLQVEAVAATLAPGESAIGERRWKKELGEGRWLAYCQILQTVNAVEFRTDDARSRRYTGGGAWKWVEEYEKHHPSEPY